MGFGAIFKPIRKCLNSIKCLWILTHVISVLFIFIAVWKYSVAYDDPNLSWDDPIVVAGALALTAMFVNFLANILSTIIAINNDNERANLFDLKESLGKELNDCLKRERKRK